MQIELDENGMQLDREMLEECLDETRTKVRWLKVRAKSSKPVLAPKRSKRDDTETETRAQFVVGAKSKREKETETNCGE